jgi:hypothetical protein
MVKYNDGLGSHICGHTSYHDHLFEIEVEFDHTADMAEIMLSTTLNSAKADESFGFRDFQVKSPKPANGVCPSIAGGVTQCPLVELFHGDVFSYEEFD